MDCMATGPFCLELVLLNKLGNSTKRTAIIGRMIIPMMTIGKIKMKKKYIF